jgi:hypothetical protein
VSLPISSICRYVSSSVFPAGAMYTGTLSLPRASTMLLMSFVSTTRSGFLPAIASAFGVNPDRSVFGASAG